MQHAAWIHEVQRGGRGGIRSEVDSAQSAFFDEMIEAGMSCHGSAACEGDHPGNGPAPARCLMMTTAEALGQRPVKDRSMMEFRNHPHQGRHVGSATGTTPGRAR